METVYPDLLWDASTASQGQVFLPCDGSSPLHDSDVTQGRIEGMEGGYQGGGVKRDASDARQACLCAKERVRYDKTRKVGGTEVCYLFKEKEMWKDQSAVVCGRASAEKTILEECRCLSNREDRVCYAHCSPRSRRTERYCCG